MGARRNLRRRDWPRGLYEVRPGYFVWRHPDPSHAPFQFVIGRVELQFAIDEAIDTNNRISARKPRLGDLVMGGAHTLAELIGKMPGSDRENTAKQRRALDARIVTSLGSDTGVHTVTVADCAKAIEALIDAGTPSMAVGVRSRLSMLFKKAMHLGWVTINPALATEPPKVTVQRDRLTLAQFHQVLAASTHPWLPLAMRLLMVTGQDRDTVARMHVGMLQALRDPSSDVVRDYLVVQRAKTRDTNQPVAIPLDLRLHAVDLQLRTLVAGRDGYFVRRENGEPLLPDAISAAFSDARRAAGIPDVMPSGKLAPTFYEIKSLAKRLFKAQGDVDTMHLFSHSAGSDALYADPRGVEPVFVAIDAKGK